MDPSTGARFRAMCPSDHPARSRDPVSGAVKVDIAGIRIDNVSMSEAVEAIERMTGRNASGYVVTPNVDHVVRYRRDAGLRAAYAGAALVVADGMPLIWSSRFLGTPLKERVAGSDLLFGSCELAERKGYRLFFLGGRAGAASGAADKIREMYPGIRIIGHYSPPFGFEKDRDENERIIRMIRDVGPDLLFVGLGSPKQEKWILEHGHACGVPATIAIGGSFEFASGLVRRAPRWMQRAGLEWLWRLAMEPGRLWRRYLRNDPVFFWYILEQRWRAAGRNRDAPR